MKFDKEIVDNLITQISEELKQKISKRTPIKLSLKENNIIKHINPSFAHDRLGEYNGYGYKKLGKHLMPENFVKTKRALLKLETKIVKKKKPVNKTLNWYKRLSKLTGISLEQAESIANEKVKYKHKKIQEMEEKQHESYSIKRQTLINKMIRENPLRYIKNKEHAEAIVIAHERHTNTNYEDKLFEAKLLVESGDLEPGKVKDYARKNFEEI
jgi:hypothetical protein